MSTPTDRSTPRSVESFHEALALSSRRLGFSVTQNLPPLACAHCSVSASPGAGATTFTGDFGRRVAAQRPELARLDIRFIDFTGGEPTLARDFVQTVSRAATEAGVQCGIVSAAHWATSPARARRFLAMFPHIDNWDISVDVYHLPFVSLDRIRVAFAVLSDMGKPPLIRIAHHEPMTYEDARLIDEVYGFAGRRIAFQPIGPVGRAADLVTAELADLTTYDRSPCPTTGPLVQPGGRVAPCCAPLSHEDGAHPMRLGNAFDEPLADIVQRWRTHPLLQTMRVFGMAPVVNWLEEAGVDTAQALRARQCDTCVALARQDDWLWLADRRARGGLHRLRLAHALETHFGETWLGEVMVAEAVKAQLVDA